MDSQRKRMLRRIMVAGLLIVTLLATGINATVSYLKMEKVQKPQENGFLVALQDRMQVQYFPMLAFIQEGEKVETALSMEGWLAKEMPLYAYCMELEDQELFVEDEMTTQKLLEKEGTDEENKNIGEEALDYDENALHIEDSLMQQMEQENSQYNREQEERIADGKEQAETVETSPAFEKAKYPVYTYDWSENWDYETLVSNFYAVDAATAINEEQLDWEAFLEKDLSVDRESEGPQILIYHTHALEAFTDSNTENSDTTIVGAGELLATILEEEYGFTVLHHSGIYDRKRDMAYANALPAVEALLEENPTIEVVIDLHRDEMKEGRKLVMDLQGKPTARFMFFNGLSYTRSNGELTNLENPYIQENLAFSFQAQVAANEYYPGIARKIYLKAYRYNMHLRAKSMLIELGAQTNTVEEIRNACEPLAHILAIVLGG